jgi:hypothetical protein
MSKKGKKPTYEQRKIMQRNGIDTYMWLVQSETPNELRIIHRETKEVKVIDK